MHIHIYACIHYNYVICEANAMARKGMDLAEVLRRKREQCEDQGEPLV